MNVLGADLLNLWLRHNIQTVQEARQQNPGSDSEPM